jgi:hypothetical protein
MRTLLLPEELACFTRDQLGLISTSQCREVGVSPRTIRSLLERREWSLLTRGVYDTMPGTRLALTWLERHQRAAWAALLAYGPDAVPVGTSAIALLGVQGLPMRITPEAALPNGRSAISRDGLQLRQFDAGMVCVHVAGRLVASPEWALAQAVPELDRDHAVAVMDSSQNLGLLDADGLQRAHDLARHRRGVDRTHGWWAQSDARAESALETFGRLDCVDGAVPPDDLQVPITTIDGRFLGRGDMGWRQRNGRWLIAELDGREVHELPTALLHDRHRQNGFLIDGDADVLRFTYRDLRPRGAIARTVLRRLAG